MLDARSFRLVCDGNLQLVPQVSIGSIYCSIQRVPHANIGRTTGSRSSWMISSLD